MTALDLGMPQPAGPATALPKPTLKLSVWLCDLTYTQQAISAETTPQAVAGLVTYASTRMTFATPPRIFKFPEDLAAALEEHGPPDVIGFSHYIWNSQLSHAAACVIKQHFPGTTVVMGGPHYPLLRSDQVAFWHQRLAGAVDFYVEGEGEIAFTELLAHLEGNPRKSVRGTIPGVHSLSPDRREAFTPRPRARLTDLSQVPSPYLAQLLDEYLERGAVPTVQTNRGCPFKCDFCQEGTQYFQRVAKKTEQHIAEELHYIGRTMAPLVAAGTARNELLITDSNFGMFPEDKNTCRVLAECQQAYGWPRVVNVTTGKNQRERVLEAVAQLPGAISLSGSVQSLDPDVLDAVHRKNIDPAKMMDIALASAETGTGSYSEVILALPGDSKTKHLDSLRGLLDASFDRLNMFQLTLLPGSEMYAAAYRERWGLTTRWRVIPRCFGHYTILGCDIRTAELDEVCVTLPEMPYEDYLACRVMNLLVASLYNGGVFATVLALLRAHDISPMRWLELCRDLEHGPQLACVLADFTRETDQQLWPSREELLTYAATNVERYIDGELGNNLLYTYRMRMLSEALEDLADLAARAGLAALREVGAARDGSSYLAQLLEEGVDYHRLQFSHVFRADPSAELTQRAEFDIDQLLTDARTSGDVSDFRRYRFPQPRLRRFVLTDRQLATMRTYMRQLGRSKAGIGWLLTKVRLPDIVREVRTPARVGGGPQPPRSDAVTQ